MYHLNETVIDTLLQAWWAALVREPGTVRFDEGAVAAGFFWIEVAVTVLRTRLEEVGWDGAMGDLDVALARMRTMVQEGLYATTEHFQP
jgi:hypothetical protein